MFNMADRVDELFDTVRKVELSILSRLGEQDVRLARMEEGQKAIHQRIDNHMEKEELLREKDNAERISYNQRIHSEIHEINSSLKRVSSAESQNTGWRLWLQHVGADFKGFLKFVGFGVILSFIYWVFQNAGLIK